MSVHCIVESNARLNETTALRTLRTDVTTHSSTLLPSLFKHGNGQSLLHPADLAQDNTKGCQHCPLKQRRSHEMPSLRHTTVLHTLTTDRTTHCSTLLPSHFKHRNDQSLLHPAACARQQKRSPFTAQDRQAIQLASFQCQLMSLDFILKSNAQLNEADRTMCTFNAITMAN